MKSCKVLRKFVCLRVDDLGSLVEHNEDYGINIMQKSGEVLEVWKERSDGYLFVYGESLEIGYWVNPHLVEVIEEKK